MERETQAPRVIRRQPTQRRSRERVERILRVTIELLEAQGSDALKMSEVAKRAGIPIGSLYQYFPDKTSLIAELAERYNAEGRACVEGEFAGVRQAADIVEALHRVIDAYYGMYLSTPAMHDIWGATQADKVLQELDRADVEAHAAILLRALELVYPQRPRELLANEALLLMHLVCASIRLAISVEPGQARIILDTLKGLIASADLLR